MSEAHEPLTMNPSAVCSELSALKRAPWLTPCTGTCTLLAFLAGDLADRSRVHADTRSPAAWFPHAITPARLPQEIMRANRRRLSEGGESPLLRLRKHLNISSPQDSLEDKTFREETQVEKQIKATMPCWAGQSPGGSPGQGGQIPSDLMIS